MGIYIKGVEMPGLIHGPITIRIYPTGKCINMGSLWPRDSMPGVTAIPVPEHGDLIERSAVCLTDFEIAMCGGDYKEGMKMLLEKVEAAPAVIPASGEEKL